MTWNGSLYSVGSVTHDVIYVTIGAMSVICVIQVRSYVALKNEKLLIIHTQLTSVAEKIKTCNSPEITNTLPSGSSLTTVRYDGD